MSGQRNDVLACGVAGVDQQPVGRPAVAAGDVVDHRPRQACVVAPVGHGDRDNDAFLGRRGDLGVIGRANGAVGKAHETRLGIARRSPRLFLPGLVLGVLRRARLALSRQPLERRPRSSRARLNITRCPLARRLPSTRRSPRILRQLPLEGDQPLGDRGFDLEQFFARLERFLAGAGADLRAVDGDLRKYRENKYVCISNSLSRGDKVSSRLGELALLEDERVIEPVRQRLDVGRFDRRAAPDAQARGRVAIGANVERDLFLLE